MRYQALEGQRERKVREREGGRGEVHAELGWNIADEGRKGEDGPSIVIVEAAPISCVVSDDKIVMHVVVCGNA
jgi:hypothetical protein